jgi:hypothetical protein
MRTFKTACLSSNPLDGWLGMFGTVARAMDALAWLELVQRKVPERLVNGLDPAADSQER